MVIRFAVFDLDGTLVDSSVDIANAANAVIEELGGVALPHEAIVAMVGEGAGVLIRRALAASGLDRRDARAALERFLVHYDAHLLDHTLPYDGMVTALRRIGERLPLAVLTNKPARATELMLDGLRLRHRFREAIGGDTAFGRKPDPAGLLHLAVSAGVLPAETLMVGDSPIDLATARAAGTQICLARYGFGYRFAPADFRGDELFADSAEEIADLVEARSG